MKYTFKRPLMLQIIFYVNTVLTAYLMYELITRVLLNASAIEAQKTVAGLISRSQIYLSVGVIFLFMISQWLGAFIMYNRKTWGYVLYIIPNVLFLALLVFIMIYVSTMMNTIIIASVVFVMIVMFTVELFCLRSLRKKERSKVLQI